MDIREVLRMCGVETREHGAHHHVSRGWLGTQCPLCSKESNHFRLGWNLTTGAVSCWSCGVINRVDALQELTGLDKRTCWDLLDKIDYKAYEGVRATGKLVLPKGLGDLLPAHRKYLEGRGFDPDELVRLWGIKGIGPANRLAWRIWIPVRLNSQIVSFTARAIVDGVSAKYANAKPEEERVSAKSLVFGNEFVRHAVIVTEGPFDAMRIGPGAVATMGVVFTPQQVAWLSKVPVRVICFDNEPKAQRRADKLANELAIFDGVTHVVQLDSPDPGSASPDEVAQLRGFLA